MGSHWKAVSNLQVHVCCKDDIMIKPTRTHAQTYAIKIIRMSLSLVYMTLCDEIRAIDYPHTAALTRHIEPSNGTLQKEDSPTREVDDSSALPARRWFGRLASILWTALNTIIRHKMALLYFQHKNINIRCILKALTCIDRKNENRENVSNTNDWFTNHSINYHFL